MIEHAADRPAGGADGRPRGKLRGWIAFVAALATITYAANFAVEGGPEPDVLYQWATAIGALVQYAIMLMIALLLARGLGGPALGLLRPRSWPRAGGLVAASLVAIFVLGAALNTFLEAGEEQGLVPDAWDGSRAAPFAANFVVIALLAPAVEELVFRGVGMAVVGAYASIPVTIFVTGLAFGLAHGLVVALPVLTIFGCILGWLRHRTASIYPAMVLHGIFNALSLIAAVTVG